MDSRDLEGPLAPIVRQGDDEKHDSEEAVQNIVRGAYREWPNEGGVRPHLTSLATWTVDFCLLVAKLTSNSLVGRGRGARTS